MAFTYTRPTGPQPNRGVFGARSKGDSTSTGSGSASGYSGVNLSQPITRPKVERPAFGDFGTPSREGIGEVRGEALGFLNDFNHPQQSGAFKDLMNLASERTASAAGEETRLAREASQRRGYAGGSGSAGRRAATDRMQALALTGLEGASAIREQSMPGYQAATGAYAGLAGGYNEQMSQRNLAYAAALQDARQLQAQLDSAFNNQLIDAGKYSQMSESIQKQFEIQKMRLEEDARQFDAKQKGSPLDWARAETERMGTIGPERYRQPGFAEERLEGPEGMNPGSRPRSPFDDSYGPAFGSGSGFGGRR